MQTVRSTGVLTTSPQLNGRRLPPQLTERSSEPTLDNAATAGKVAQLSSYTSEAALYIADNVTPLTSPQMADAQMQQQ